MFFAGDVSYADELAAAPLDLGMKSTGSLPSELGFHSDPYRETDDAMRGAPMAQFGSSGQFYKPCNDFYAADDDDVVRGVCMAQAPGHGSLFSKPTDFSKLAEDSGDGGFFSNFMPQSLERSLKDGSYSSMPYSSLSLQGSACHERFQDGDVPPAPPTSQHFNFEATTSFITSTKIHQVANSILDFLDSELIASVSKVRRHKYSIKADVFHDNIMCSTKIRIWRLPSKPNEYAIEFQRRSGDPFAFGAGYRQCVDFLAAPSPPVSGQSMLQLPPPPFAEERSEDELNVEMFPLLELAGMDQFPNLQAEAASSLAKLACEDICIAKFLSKTDVLDKLVPLLACDGADVVYPTARMLSAIAIHSTEKSIAEHCIVKLMIEKIRAPSTNQLMCLELAKAISAAVRSCVYHVSMEHAQDLERLLESATQELANKPGMTLVRNTLQDVLMELNSYSYPAFTQTSRLF